MKFFVAGVIVAWVVEWLLFTFWWKKKSSPAREVAISAVRGTGQDDGLPQPFTMSRGIELPGAAAAGVPVVASNVAVEAAAKEAEPVAASDAVAEAPSRDSEPAGAQSSGEQAVESAGDSPLASAFAKARKAGTELRMIAGIGPKTQELLNAAGFQTLDHLAAADPKELKAVLDAAGSRFALIDPESWPQQARMILAGDAEGLRKIQDGLKK